MKAMRGAWWPRPGRPKPPSQLDRIESKLDDLIAYHASHGNMEARIAAGRRALAAATAGLEAAAKEKAE